MVSGFDNVEVIKLIEIIDPFEIVIINFLIVLIVICKRIAFKEAFDMKQV